MSARALQNSIKAARREDPASINETAQVVGRDTKEVHDELTQLAQLGIIRFEDEGQRTRPVVWFDELVINLAFDLDTGETGAGAS